jgi:hypothetical protein
MNASQEELRSSYYKLAMEYHPDRNPGNLLAEEYFKRINEAYQVLRDPVKRQWYNLMLQGNNFKQQIDPRKYGTRGRASYAAPAQVFVDDDKRPLWLRLSVPGLTMLWGLLLIFNNWFITSKGYEAAKVFAGILMFLVASYFFVNALYIWWLKLQSENKINFNPEQRSLIIYILLLFLTVPFFWGIGSLRKTWHLSHYGIVTKANITLLESFGDDYHAELLYFSEDQRAYTKRLEFTCPFRIHLKDIEIYVKYSEREPRITAYNLKMVSEDSVMQRFFMEWNKDNDYFSDF